MINVVMMAMFDNNTVLDIIHNDDVVTTTIKSYNVIDLHATVQNMAI